MAAVRGPDRTFPPVEDGQHSDHRCNRDQRLIAEQHKGSGCVSECRDAGSERCRHPFPPVSTDHRLGAVKVDLPKDPVGPGSKNHDGPGDGRGRGQPQGVFEERTAGQGGELFGTPETPSRTSRKHQASGWFKSESGRYFQTCPFVPLVIEPTIAYGRFPSCQ